jgi:hypothetical protein
VPPGIVRVTGKSCLLLESEAQARWLVAHRAELLEATLLVAVTPEAVLACQLLGLSYSKFEEYADVAARRAQYAGAVQVYLDWQRWVDDWVRQRVPELAGTAFGPAECASYNLQMLHAEIWSTGTSLGEFFTATGIEEIVLWRPEIRGVAGNLHPEIVPLVALAADFADQVGVAVRDMTRENPELGSVSVSPLVVNTVRSRVERAILEGPARGVAAAFRSGGMGDALRAMRPWRYRTKGVLACGYGYDLQRALLEIRRMGVPCRQMGTRLPSARAASRPVIHALQTLRADLFRESALWTPAESSGVGRTAVWGSALEAWWDVLVPRYWEAYRSAARRFSTGHYSSVVVNSIGDESSDGPVVAAARAAGVRTLLYQHGGSADLDSPSLIAWLRGVDEVLVYGEGTAADLSETVPAFADRIAALSPVGSSSLDEIAARGRTAQHRRLRERLQNGDPRPLMLYVPTHFAPYGRAVSELAGHPVASYFELLQRVFQLWRETPGVRLVYKDFPVANDPSRLMPAFIRDRIPDAVITTVRLTDLMWAVDAIVVDHVISAAAQVLLADAPIVFHMPAVTPQAARARTLLRPRAEVAVSQTDFIDGVRRLLRKDKWEPIDRPDREFLARYGTFRGDGRSAHRAAQVIAGRSTTPILSG